MIYYMIKVVGIYLKMYYQKEISNCSPKIKIPSWQFIDHLYSDGFIMNNNKNDTDYLQPHNQLSVLSSTHTGQCTSGQAC